LNTSVTAAEVRDGDGDGREALVVRAWRAQQLRRRGLPSILAETFADAATGAPSPR
jgi:hypothetical protein